MDEIPEWAMKKAATIGNFRGAESRQISVARALATERENAAKAAETLIPNGKGKSQKVAHAAGHHIAAAIRRGE